MSLFLDFLYPRSCYSCGCSNTYLCSKCEPLQSTRDIRHLSKSAVSGVISVYRYTGVIRQMIEDYKFSFVSDLASTFSNLMYHHLQANFPNILQYWQKNNFVLVSVPLHQHRHNWRGFNQSELLCRHLSPLLHLKSQNLLIRTIDSTPQSTLKDKHLRHQNTQNIFQLNNNFFSPLPVKGEGGGGLGFVLVDDVYTTGSTLTSATMELQKITTRKNQTSSFSKSARLRQRELRGDFEIWGLTIAG